MTLRLSPEPLPSTLSGSLQGQRCNEFIPQSFPSTLIFHYFSLAKSEVASKILYPTLHRYLSATEIIPIVESYTTTTWDLLEREGSMLEGVGTPLSDFVIPVVSQASGYAFFGRSFSAAEFCKPLNDFNGGFHLFLAGLPRAFLKKHTNGLAKMQWMFERYFDGPHDDASELVLESEQVMRKHGYVCLFLKSAGNLGSLTEHYSRIRAPLGLSSSLSYYLL